MEPKDQIRLEQLYERKFRINHADKLSNSDREALAAIEREINKLRPRSKAKPRTPRPQQGTTLEETLAQIKEKFGRKS